MRVLHNFESLSNEAMGGDVNGEDVRAESVLLGSKLSVEVELAPTNGDLANAQGSFVQSNGLPLSIVYGGGVMSELEWRLDVIDELPGGCVGDRRLQRVAFAEHKLKHSGEEETMKRRMGLYFWLSGWGS